MSAETTQTEVRHFRELYNRELEANKLNQAALAQIRLYVKSYETKNLPAALAPILKILKDANL